MKAIIIILVLANFLLAESEEKSSESKPTHSPLRALGQVADRLLFGGGPFDVHVHVTTNGELKADKEIAEKMKDMFKEEKMPLYKKGDNWSVFGITVIELDSELLLTADFNFGIWATIELLQEDEDQEKAILNAAKEFIRQFKYDNRAPEEVFASYKN